MALQLTNMKIAWTCSRTKCVTSPTPDSASTHSSYQKYLKRRQDENQLSFLEWLRAYNDSPTKPTRYHSGETLVGVKLLSMFNPLFFYQFLIMHHPHTCEHDLHHPDEDSLPAAVRYFVKAAELAPLIWNSQQGLRNYLAAEPHKAHFVDTVCYFISSLHDICHLWELKVIGQNVTDVFSDNTAKLYPLSPQQNAVYGALVAAVYDRRQDREYSRSFITLPSATSQLVTASLEPSQRTTVVVTDESLATGPLQGPEETEDWRKLRVILGKAGTGKSQVLIRVVHHCLINEFKCLVVAPVALLASHYRHVFADRVDANTLHSVFRIPVKEDDAHTINFSL